MTLLTGSWRRSYSYVLAATVGVVAAADYFIYDGRALGWTSAVVAAVLLLALSVRDWSFLRTTGGKVFAGAAVGLLLALVEQPTWLNVLYALVCLAVIALINHFGWQADFWPWVRRLGRWLFTAWIWPAHDNSVVIRWLVRRGFSPRVARGIAAWIIPLLLSSVFVAIFAWANPVISNWLSDLGTWIDRIIQKLPDLISFPRLMFWLVVGMFAWMLLRGPVRWWRKRYGPLPGVVDAKIVSDDDTAGALPLGLVVRCLILFNVVFAVENVLDLAILYGHHAPIDGTTYKQYVHRGAYPLVAAALLAGAFVLITFRPNSRTEQSKAARQLVYAWIGQTILLTVSASLRLVKYVDITELTRLRVASSVWFILVGCGLFYIVWRIVAGKSNRWLVNVNALTALVLLYPCCFINFDGMIADFNAAHCRDAGGEGSPLDIEYFRSLGTPGLAALDRVRDRLEPGWRRDLAAQVSSELSAELKNDLGDWRSWTWRRQRTAEAVREVAIARANTPRAARPQLARAR